MNRYERLLRRAYRQLRDVRADGGGDLEGDERGQAARPPPWPALLVAVVGGTAILASIETIGWVPTVVYGLVVVLTIALLPVVRPSLRKGWP